MLIKQWYAWLRKFLEENIPRVQKHRAISHPNFAPDKTQRNISSILDFFFHSKKCVKKYRFRKINTKFLLIMKIFLHHVDIAQRKIISEAKEDHEGCRQ